MLVAQQQLGSAAKKLQNMHTQHPDSVPVATLLARLQLRQGHAQEALDTAASLRGSDQTIASSYALTGELLEAQNKYKAATEAYAKVYDMHPTSGLALRLFEMRRRGKLPHPDKP